MLYTHWLYDKHCSAHGNRTFPDHSHSTPSSSSMELGQGELVYRGSAAVSAALALVLLLAVSSRAHAVGDITSSDLEAASRAIGFINNLPNDGTIVIGIVYADTAEAKAKATQAADLLGNMQGPRKAKFRTVLVAAKNLGQVVERLDAVLLMPNQAISSAEIAAAVRRRRVVSISTEPGCIDAKCCVLMVSTVGRVRIVLDTALANTVGAHLSSIFMMMVERK